MRMHLIIRKNILFQLIRIMVSSHQVMKKVKFFDLFGSSVNLNINGQQFHRTYLGLFGTIVIIVGFFAVFWSNVIGFFNLQYLSHNTYYIIDINQNLSFNQDNFKFAISLTNYNLERDDLFQFYLQQNHRFQNGTSLTFPYIKLQKCQLDSWLVYGQDFQTYYNANGLNNYLCSPKNFSFEIKGQFGSPAFKYLKIAVTPCMRPECESRINQFVKANRYVQYNIVYLNKGVNYSNTFQPFINYPDKSFYRFIPYNTLLSIDQFVIPQNVSTDISLFPFQNIKNNLTYDISKDFYTTTVPHTSKNTQFFRHFIRISPKQLIIERKVQKLDQFLSFLGGIFSILQLLGLILLTPYAEFKAKIKIFNQSFFLSRNNTGIQQNEIQNKIDIHPNFLKFLFYRIFNWMNCFDQKVDFWNICSYKICQTKAQERLDIIQITSKINYLAKSVEFLLSNQQKQILQKLKLTAVYLFQSQQQKQEKKPLKQLLQDFKQKDRAKFKKLTGIIMKRHQIDQTSMQLGRDNV